MVEYTWYDNGTRERSGASTSSHHLSKLLLFLGTLLLLLLQSFLFLIFLVSPVFLNDIVPRFERSSTS